MDSLVITKDKQAVTTSMQVAETFEKEHKNILRDIEKIIEEDQLNFEPMFKVSNEPDSYNRPRKIYYMNRDGFSFLVMGFTGSKAREFKLKYINAFNEMENHIKQQMDMSNLSPELQLMANLVNNMAKQEMAQRKLETKIDNISDIVSLNTTDWRKDANALINRVVKVAGGTPEAHKETRSAIFKEVDRRAGVQLETRLTNKRRRMADEGASKSKRDGLTKVDVISDDKKLVEIYVAVVKEFAIKYGVYK